jgi:hypothetical protein
LVRQKVTYQLGSLFTLDWSILIDGYMSDDRKYYCLKLYHAGGNLAGGDIDYYADFDTEKHRLTLYVRQKLHRGKYTRYQFGFKLQESPLSPPDIISTAGVEIRYVFVPMFVSHGLAPTEE